VQRRPPPARAVDIRLRGYRDRDEAALVELTIETFRPFYEQSFPAMVGHDAELIAHQHGAWEQDYRDEIPTLHEPERGKQVVVAEVDGRIAGFVAWKPDPRPQHAEISLLAVESAHRHTGVGSALMNAAMDELRAAGIGFVGLGTGGDDFHAPARRLYESLGFHAIPIVGYLRSL
jgi:ribosomal protein S18 acetylase RimI-like enzyme